MNNEQLVTFTRKAIQIIARALKTISLDSETSHYFAPYVDHAREGSSRLTVNVANARQTITRFLRTRQETEKMPANLRQFGNELEKGKKC